MQTDCQHVSIGLGQSVPVMYPYVIQDLTSWQQVIFIYKREVAKHLYLILELNHCPATGVSLFVDEFLFQIYEVLVRL